MGKSKKQKAKNADFKKVKLKAGRVLKKQNDTDTSFKAGKLILVDQLKQNSAAAPLTHRKLCLQVKILSIFVQNSLKGLKF